MYVFFNKRTGKQLAAISMVGCFEGEIRATKELLAYEHELEISDIEVREGTVA